MVAWAALKGVTRIDATAATGKGSFTGGIGTDVPAGTVITTIDGTQYTTDADWAVGSAPFSFTAVVPGASSNAVTGVALSLQSPISGITSGAATSPIGGGSDQEADESLRSRMLQAYADPPDGGSANQFTEWALQVPGVTRAWVVGQGAGIGSVLIYIMLDEAESANNGFAQGSTGGASVETRIAAATGEQLITANYIYTLRPVTSLVQVATPTPAPINFTINSLLPADGPTETAIIAALSDLFVRLGSPIAGSLIYPSDVNAAIESVSGVNRYTLVSPVTPISVAAGSLPTVGVVSFT